MLYCLYSKKLVCEKCFTQHIDFE